MAARTTNMALGPPVRRAPALCLTCVSPQILPAAVLVSKKIRKMSSSVVFTPLCNSSPNLIVLLEHFADILPCITTNWSFITWCYRSHTVCGYSCSSFP
ncbi:hypothetical protein FKM82_001939 [Ascaphus truei]